MSKEKDRDMDGDLAVKEKSKTQKPKKYRVILHNDDYTPMDFVVTVLKQIYRKADPEANQIMLTVHKRGAATCGVYSHEIAETKMVKTIQYAKQEGHPLQCTMESE